MSPLDFIITDRVGIETGVLVRGAYIVISIHDPDRARPRVRRQMGLRAMLQLAFDDAEPTASPALDAQVTLMTPEQAVQIWRFVDDHAEAVAAVVVQCEAGMSRSPAVAAALCRGRGGDDGRFWEEYMPNPFVYRLVLEAAEADGRHPRLRGQSP